MTATCKWGHDHSQPGFWVSIPLEPGRKYHCASRRGPTVGPEPSGTHKPKRDGKRRPENWTEGTLAEAVAKGVPQCELCFGIRR